MSGRISGQIARAVGLASALFGVGVVLSADIPDGRAKRQVVSGLVFLLAAVGLVSSGGKMIGARSSGDEPGLKGSNKIADEA